MLSVLVIQPDDEDPPERLAEWLVSEGFDLKLVRPFAGEPVPTALEQHALVVLGGDMGAGDVSEYPWLADVMELLRHSVAVAAPTLGVCLGGQLLAAAHGGRVEPGAAGMEAGTVEVTPRAEAELDRLAGGLPWPLRMITMHRDAIVDLPPGAVWLAASEPYRHQIFRLGPVAWGVQFHPEVSPATYEAWASYVTDTGEALRRVVDGVVDVDRDADQVLRHAEALVRAFAAVVRGASEMDVQTRQLQD